MSTETDKFCCESLHWKGRKSEVLTAPDPFNPGYELTACPKCREAGTLLPCCDEPGCWGVAGYGTPSPTGYRRVCGEHCRAINETTQAKG